MSDRSEAYAPLLSTAEMGAIEAACIARDGASAFDLMARAADGVTAAIADLATPGRAVVVCGPGNNGGDGYAVASRLHDLGWAVRVLALGSPGDAQPAAAHEAAGWAIRGPVEPFDRSVGPVEADLAVDALFGTGLSRPLDAAPAETWAAVIAAPLVVAVDAPSGLCLDTGRDLGVVARADLTVTFHAAKRGHHLGIGPNVCGRLLVHDIGCSPDDEAAAGAIGACLAVPQPGLLRKDGAAHKYEHGHVLVLGGGIACGGAARLAARAALRVGAGLVTLAVPPAALIENAARLDAVMLRRLEGAAGLGDLLSDKRLSALVIGPGFGVGAATRETVVAALSAGRALVLDADALTSFAAAPETLFAATQGGKVALTPHSGEFARLFPDLAPDAAGVQSAAVRAGATVLLKGRATLIASPDQSALTVAAATYDQAAPWLATAGSGDVLAGLIGGLLARGLTPHEASAQAAWLHAAAARVAGPGMIAEDLPEAVPAVLRGLSV